ncbi:MAG: hypothetical protein RL095_3383 [Verrucomicrobiota bacterium]
MVDTAARSALAEAIRGYLQEDLTAFQLDDALDKIQNSTRDETVLLVAKILWFSYDDLKDHSILADKQSWDSFHRLLLLLESGCEVQWSPSKWDWGWPQCLALLFLGIYLAIAVPSGWGNHLLILGLPFGLAIWAVSWTQRVQGTKDAVEAAAHISPFTSWAELRQARRRVPHFFKPLMSEVISRRRIRHPFTEKIMTLSVFVMLSIFSPLVFLIQSLPQKRKDLKIVFFPEQCSENGRKDGDAP